MNDLPIFLILPFGLGLMYSLAAIAFKRAMEEKIDIWRIIFFSNLATGILLIPLLLFANKPQPAASFYQPILAGLVFFAGIVLNIFAIHRGDVSVATPLLGTKVLFVAFFTMVVLSEPVSPSLWLATIFVVVSFKLLQGFGNRPATRFWTTVLFALGSSSAFALCDVFFQAWARLWGIGLFIPVVFTVVLILSFGLRFGFPGKTGSFSTTARRWLIAGCILNALQTVGMLICVGFFRHVNAATAVNIVYNSRGIWSVLLVWLVGHWFGNIEREQGARIMMPRLVGAVLLLSAIILTLLQR